jgi:hypothetical protein
MQKYRNLIWNNKIHRIELVEAPYAMKVAPTVLTGGKGGDNFKSLPICMNKVIFNISVKSCFKTALVHIQLLVFLLAINM